MFSLDKTFHLKRTLERNGSQIKQTVWDTYFNWHAESSKSLQYSKVASLKDSLQKANKKLKTQEVPTAKDSDLHDSCYTPLSSFT